ncbi:DUF2637 domain-containing protein [Rothia nasimurium]|uniref:DUF2637 domain-containing protein n=1 Tax=Rothia nasimurium TaxID=85336 RepID=A0A4Y9F5V3_9MICC|nr:DUF2637 domain-containing protein [Rothia nasimurium]MBF0807314.1 DUF2637 domain-containing protein [Rothia nasimurium]TFU23829.1 DUF2637 domain-containing protein [Rothia nasimurium]
MKNTHTKNQARINPDSRAVLWFTVLLVLLLGVTSFMVSFNGLHDVASWVGLPPWLRWTVPVFIDIAILAYSMAAVIHRARGEAVALTWGTLMVFTLISVFANGAHALTVGGGQSAAQSWIGAAIAAAAPLSVFAATEELSRLAFGKPEDERSFADADGGSSSAAGLSPGKFERELLAAGEKKVLGPGGVPGAAEFAELEKNEVTAAIEAAAGVSQIQGSPEMVEDDAGANLHEDEAEGGDEDVVKLREWVRSQQEAGQKITGVEAAAVIGKSAKTARNKLKLLKEWEPGLFDE